ncbi:MAG TPA: hypothetical protein VHV82_05985 [Sporichthyaceae bacterium]|jgi:hypothetical protein|nr:hypothetical protein [Sporichthyaceae bacterium]
MDLVEVLRAQWDRCSAVVATIAGAVLLIVGWYHVADTGFVAKQMPYLISEGLGGVFLLGVGGMLWLSADLRDQWRELRGMRRWLESAASDRDERGTSEEHKRAKSAGDEPIGATPSAGR